NGFTYLLSQCATFAGKVLIRQDRREDLCQLFEHHSREEVRWNQIRVHTRIVRRAEGRVNQTDWTSRITQTIERRSVNWIICGALKSIRTRCIKSLLFAKSLDDQPTGLLPIFVETRHVSGCLPVRM